MASGNESESKDKPNDSFLLLSYLDEVEDRVESLRRNALALLQERDSLLTVLSQLKEESLNGSVSEGEAEEIRINIARLQKRCGNVEVKVRTQRSPEQESSYSKVHSLVKELESLCVQGDPENVVYRLHAKSYLNACVSDSAVSGPVDYKFQQIILGCKLEDQKLIRHRLECLVEGRCHVNFMEEALENMSLDQDSTQYNENNKIFLENSATSNGCSNNHSGNERKQEEEMTDTKSGAEGPSIPSST